MSLAISPRLWQAVCQFLRTYPTAEVTLRQHEGTVRSALCTTVLRDHDPGEVADEVSEECATFLKGQRTHA